MNRSILIVIVDFLLLSLLVFAKFDDLEPREAQQAQTSISNTASGQQDLVSVLKVSLDQERQSRAKVDAELSQTKEILQKRDDLLADREKRIRETQE
jgi:hypothetical protein